MIIANQLAIYRPISNRTRGIIVNYIMNLAGQIFLKLAKLRSENGLIQLRDVLF